MFVACCADFDSRTPHGVRGLKLRYILTTRRALRRTPHGVRGLKLLYEKYHESLVIRRTPHGVRGLKSRMKFIAFSARLSHPAWGAWIEISVYNRPDCKNGSHPAWGAWIEILSPSYTRRTLLCRTPHGVRGLKLIAMAESVSESAVAPRMGCVD